ncbi:unnamed protein product [Danaus chrysippus]|uniref:(African queen) hypothetical protein n=1 Tax=Danaus chrysippus TaxID=151541 RepID=A0A8J2QEY5_9NEOP|nr:unnamed protein product [Danaus chrysippus]
MESQYIARYISRSSRGGIEKPVDARAPVVQELCSSSCESFVTEITCKRAPPTGWGGRSGQAQWLASR